MAVMTVDEMLRRIETDNQKGQKEKEAPKTEPRRRSAKRHPHSGAVDIEFQLESEDKSRVIKGQIIDLNTFGVGVQTSIPLSVNSEVTLTSQFFERNSSAISCKTAKVAHCQLRDNGQYCIGFAFSRPADEENYGGAGTDGRKKTPMMNDSQLDYYEVLQVSPNADPEMIQRVYRMLAQRFHPDNADTGDEETFRLILQAYRVLTDPEQRAAYDVKHKAARALRWKIFHSPEESQGVEEDERMQWAILSALYTARKRQPLRPGMSVKELEDLLGCPREHLEFALWYLKGKSQIQSADQGRYEITPEGVDAAHEISQDKDKRPSRLMIESANSEKKSQ